MSTPTSPDWRASQKTATQALKLYRTIGAGDTKEARRQLFVARSAVKDALSRDTRPLPSWAVEFDK